MSGIKSFLDQHISQRGVLRLMYYRFVAILAAYFYRFPADRLKVIAVTGTNGKSTTVNLLAGILMSAGKKVGVMSTIQFRIGDKVWENRYKQTTLGRFALQKLLRQMVSEHCEYAIVEATSHAMVQYRLWGVNVDVAVLTNIYKDHIEYHGGFDQYVEAKKSLFESLNKFGRKSGLEKIAVINRDQPAIFKRFEELPYDRIFSYGILGKGTVNASDIQVTSLGTKFVFNVPNDQIEINLRLAGNVNVANAVAAGAVALALGFSLENIRRGLEQVAVMPGRVEAIECGQDYKIIVDYAHTPDAIEQLCKTFKPITEGRLIVVFGATGGGRDKAKRPEMGQMVDKYADYIIVTDDDPYTEDRIEIIEQVSAAIKRAEGDRFWKIKHRREAIYFALNIAVAGDTVLIMGKGCEPIQIIGEEKIAWDDRKVVSELLERQVKVELELESV